MQLRDRKLFIEVYGLLRMALGVVQLVGLFFGFFLNEFCIIYPLQAIPALFGSDIVALIYLAIVIRSLFHIVVGIGISRLQNWAKFWILLGWPIVIIFNLGLAYTLYQEWLLDGYVVTGFSAVINWINFSFYAAFICFDVFFVSISIKKINEDEKFIEESGGRIERQKIGVLFFAVIFLLSIILFLGKPIRQGFHKGFYKVRSQKSLKGKEVSSLEPRNDIIKEKAQLSLAKDKDKAGEQIVQKKTEVSVIVDDNIDKGGLSRDIKGVKRENINSGFSYKGVIGFVAGLCVMIGFLLQLFQVEKMDFIRNGFVQSYVFMCVGFFLLTFYGALSKLMILWVAGGGCLLITISILIVVIKKINVQN